MTSRTLQRVALPSALVALFGCSDATGPEPDVIIPPTTQVIPASTFTGQLETISPDSTTLVMKRGNAQVDGLKGGDVLVTEAGLGYLRRIESASDSAGYLILRTSQAALTDAIEKGSVSYTGTIAPQAAGTRVLYQAPGLHAEPATIGWYLELRDVVLYDLDGDPGTKFDRILANGIIEITPSFTFDFDIDDGLQSLMVSLTLTGRDTLELSSGVSLELFDVGFPLLSFQSAPIVVLVGTVPVVITPVFSIRVGATGELFASVKASVNMEASVTGGLSYQQGEWTPFGDAQRSFGFEPPHLSAGLELRADFGPRVTFLLYGVAGPYVEASWYYELSADVTRTPWAVLYAGLDMGAGVLVRVFSRVIAEYEDPRVIGVRQKLWESPSAPLAAPTDLEATSVSASQIDLAWQDNAEGEDGFRMERCTGVACTNFVAFAEVGPNVTSYQNTGLAEATSYSYRVRAFNAGGNSGYSNTATGATGSAGRIAFTSNRDGNYEIYVMNPDGSGVTRLTNDPGEDRSPAWSPDGTRIAFHSTRTGNAEIYVMNDDGSGVTQLTSTPGVWNFDPAWSPDGTKIAFVSNREGNDEIYVMNVDGSAVTRLTDNPLNGDLAPDWSPDGTKIAFYYGQYGNFNYTISVMNADGSGFTLLAQKSILPAWSPDGTRIAFQSTRESIGIGPDQEIWVMNDDGSAATRLTSNNVIDTWPAWSPYGTRIVFASNRDGNYDIYGMSAAGLGVTRLTTDPGVDFEPAWSTR